jgi:hypothetical protein
VGQRQEAALAREIGETHCGALPDSMLPGLVRAQRAATRSWPIPLARAGPAGAVLIAGDAAYGATRRAALSRGVSTAARIVAIAQIEVEAGKSTPQDYALTFGAAKPLYDYVLFTPRAERADPCADFPRAGERAGAKP